MSGSKHDSVLDMIALLRAHASGDEKSRDAVLAGADLPDLVRTYTGAFYRLTEMLATIGAGHPLTADELVSFICDHLDRARDREFLDAELDEITRELTDPDQD